MKKFCFCPYSSELPIERQVNVGLLLRLKNKGGNVMLAQLNDQTSYQRIVSHVHILRTSIRINAPKCFKAL